MASPARKLTEGRAVFVDRRGAERLESQLRRAFAAPVDKSRLGLNRCSGVRYGDCIGLGVVEAVGHRMVAGVPVGRMCAIGELISAEEVRAEDVYAVRGWRGGW